MPHDDLLWAATRLRDRLLRLRDRPAVPHVPAGSWERVAHHHNRVQLACRAGLWRAAARERRALRSALDMHRRSLDDALLAFDDDTSVRVPPLRRLYEDLLALRDEFPEVTVDRRPPSVAVRTGPVELEGVFLDAFKIVLWLDCAGESKSYDVVALEPNSPTSRSGVPHPHVDGERLCEGDGTVPIERALVQGRPYDLFQLVDRILHTYNPDSAYVSLAEWHGTECVDCGDSVPAEEIGYCRRCGADVCDDCSRACGCEETRCSDCVTPCGGCGDTTCLSCLRRCNRCGDSFCRECLDEERCPACRKAALEEEEAETTKAAADALGDGQAAVPA